MTKQVPKLPPGCAEQQQATRRPDAHLRRRQVHNTCNLGWLTGAARVLCRALPAAPGGCGAQAGQVLGARAVGDDDHGARQPLLSDLQVPSREHLSPQ